MSVIKDVVTNLEFKDPPKYLLGEFCGKQRLKLVSDFDKKASCLTASMWKGQVTSFCKKGNLVHKYSPNDCEVIQCLPIDFTKYGLVDGIKKVISNTNRFKAIGNSWNINTITHLLKDIKLC